MTFHIHKAKSKKPQWYYTIVGNNFEVMVTSQRMKSKQACKKSIRSLQWKLSPLSIIIDHDK